MVKAQEWLEKYYSDKSTKRIIYPNKIGAEEGEIRVPLEGNELIVDNYPRLKEITINRQEGFFSSLFSGGSKKDKEVGSVRKITISNCPQLTEITIKKINCREFVLQNVPQLRSLNISGNKISELNLEEQKELVHLNTDGNPIAKSLFSFLEKREMNYSISTETRKILLVGRTGSGKSTLANILSGTNDFKESSSGLSKTKKMEVREFEIGVSSKYFENEKIKFEIIDTIGFGDTELPHKEVLREIEKTCQEIKDGLSQVLFLTRGRFTEEEWETYQILKKVVFNEEIGNFATIVRTDFVDFEDEKKCLEEIERMKSENSNFAQILGECNGKLVFVNNPSIEISGKRAEIQNALNKELREASRNILVKHLVFSFVNYQPKNLKYLSQRIKDFKTEREKLEKEIINLKKINQTNQELSHEQLKKQEKRIKELEARVEQKTKELDSKVCVVS